MKWFSWITCFFVVCLLFVWGSGYWLWTQTVRTQFATQRVEISQHLEITQNLMLSWQQGYRINLAYLQKQLADFTPVATDNPLIEPWQQVDDVLNHALWQDPLLAYAVLDSSGRVLRFSSPQASSLFAQTRTEPIGEYFLPPLVLSEQWVVPIFFRINNQSLMLWFDATALKQRIYQQLRTSPVLTEFQLISQQGELWSPSQYRLTLRARLSDTAVAPLTLEKFYAKKPPEDLMQSKQRFVSSAAWPFTSVFLAMQKKPQGMAADYYPNYIGRPALAAWRWSDAWQGFMVIERDATAVVQHQQSWWRYGLMGLLAFSGLLTFGFYLVQRRLHADEQTQSLAPTVTRHPDDETMAHGADANAESPDADARAESLEIDHSAISPDQVADVQSAEGPPDHNPLVSADLADVSATDTEDLHLMARTLPRLPVQRWPLSSYRVSEQRAKPYIVELQPAVCALIQELQPQFNQSELGVEFAEDVPLWLELPWASLQRALRYLLLQANQRAGKSEVILRVIMAEQHLLRFEMIDGGASLTEGQWLQLLHPAEQQTDDVAYRRILRELPRSAAQLSGVSEPTGNKVILSLPVQVLVAASESTQPDIQLIDATALLLSPSGELQHRYKRLLRHTGLALVPLDDAPQFVQWCTQQQQQPLDYLLLDEQFVGGDLGLAEQLLRIVRRYFPDIQLLVMTTTPDKWQSLQTELRLRVLQKPLVNARLQQALLVVGGGVCLAPVQHVWLYQPEPLQYWFQEQQLRELGNLVQKITNLAELVELSAHDIVLLPISLQAEREVASCPAQKLWTCQTFDQMATAEHCWLVGQGAAALSRALFRAKTSIHF